MGRGVAASSVGQAGARVIHLVLNVVSTLAIIRALPPGDYGAYVLVLTTTMLVGLLADYGLSKLAVREIAQHPDDPRAEAEVLGTVVLTRLGLAVVAVGATQAVLAVLGAPGEVHLAALVLSAVYFGEALFDPLMVVFHVRLRQEWEAGIRVVMEAVETALVLWLLATGAGLVALFAAPVVGMAVGVALAVTVTRRRFHTRLRPSPRLVPHLLREGLPLGPALVLGVITLKLDGLMLAGLRTSREVGLYGSAFQPIEYTFLAAGVVIGVAFPLLAAAHPADPARFGTIYRRVTEVLVGTMVLAPVALAFVGEPLLVAVYGADYAEAAVPLRLLAVTLVLMVVNAWQAFVLLSVGRQGVTLAYNAAAVALAVALNLALIPAHGMAGAAVATILDAVAVLGLSTWACVRFAGVRLDAGPLVRIGVAAAGTAAVLAGLAWLGAPWGALLVAALVAYPVATVATGALRPRAVLAAVRADGRAGAPLALAGAGALPGEVA